jgi:hypothetical protein
MGFIQSMWNTVNGMFAARRVFEDPATATIQQNFIQQYSEYQLLWAYYNNSMFDKTARVMDGAFTGSWFNNRIDPLRNGWSAYKANYNLYRNIRMIYNPVWRLVNFYSGQVYPGVLSEDGDSLPEGVPLAIPFAKDTDPALKNAIAQFWTWSGWQSKKSVMVKYGAALGSVLVELIDDVDAGQVCADIPWPGFVRDLEFDYAGNVKSYSLQYHVWNIDEGSYIYRKDVDQVAIAYYKNDEPFDYTGNGAVIENIYGFVPAVWIKHSDIGGTHGSPAMTGSFGKIDELNSLVSHVHDQVHKVIGAPLMISSDGQIGMNIFGKPTRGATNEFEPPMHEQENVFMLKAPAGATVASLAGDLSLADAGDRIKDLQTEIEKDHPELTVFDQLRAMSQVTGPAASRIIGDATPRLIDAQAMYDQGSIRIFQMAVAIAGFRANSGAWGPLNRQQQKFSQFNLQSYANGDLDMAIMPRPLLVPTKQEIMQEKTTMWTGVQAAVASDVPAEVALKDYGWTDEQVKSFTADKTAAIQRQQMLGQEDTIPQVSQ